MRFFGPRRMSALTRFPLAHPKVPHIEMADDLTRLIIPTSQLSIGKKKPLFKKFKNLVDEFPALIKLKKTETAATFYGLEDIDIALRKIMIELRKEDPLFFARLNRQQNDIESDVETEIDARVLDPLITTPLGACYFCYNAFREEGMHHSVEPVLKTLRAQHIMTVEELSKIVEFVWTRTSKLRKESTIPAVDKPTEPTYTPYVFRPVI